LLTIGILGTGFGAEHLRLFSQTAGCRVKRVFGRNREKLESLKSKYKVEVATDPSEVINDDDVDLLDICLPTGLHKEYALAGLERSKNVFIETPMCYRTEDAEQIRDSALRSNKKVYVSSFIKFFNEYNHLKSVVEKDEMGKLRAIRIYRNTPSVWGALGVEAIVHHLMIHDIDFLSSMFVAPEVTHVSAVDVDSKKSVVLVALEADDALIELEGCSLTPGTLPMSIGYKARFESGEIDFQCEFKEDGPSKRLRISTAQETNTLELKDKYPYQSMIEHVVECETKNARNLLDVDSAIKSLRIADRIRREAMAAGRAADL